jgi:transcriptional regulator with XRE-family HTH domain
MMRPEWFAGRLRQLREARGWTQPQLAGAAGVTAAAVKSLEQGRNSPTWETVVAVCRALAVTPDAFAQAPACPPRLRGRPREGAAERATPKRRKGE